MHATAGFISDGRHPFELLQVAFWSLAMTLLYLFMGGAID